MNKIFYLNNDTFQSKYTFYKDNEEALQFVTVLPFQLAIPNESIISFREEYKVFSFNFIQLFREKDYTSGSLVDNIKVEFHETRVEMTMFYKNLTFNFEEDLSQIFDELLETLNCIIVSFLIKTKDVGIYKVSKEMLEPSSLWRHILINDDGIEETQNGLFLVHPFINHVKEISEKASPDAIVSFAKAIKDEVNPFVLSEELYLNGIRLFQAGFYKESVINLQTSVETLLRNLFSEILKIDGCTKEEIESKHKELGFITLVKREFSSKIGGSWHIDNVRKEIGYWYKNCYEIRNRIIHGGYSPQYHDVENAIESVIKLRSFVLDRIKKTSKYKSISKYL